MVSRGARQPGGRSPEPAEGFRGILKKDAQMRSRGMVKDGAMPDGLLDADGHGLLRARFDHDVAAQDYEVRYALC